jgi:hypothetical protein
MIKTKEDKNIEAAHEIISVAMNQLRDFIFKDPKTIKLTFVARDPDDFDMFLIIADDDLNDVSDLLHEHKDKKLCLHSDENDPTDKIIN